jgi:serine protein kinase
MNQPQQERASLQSRTQPENSDRTSNPSRDTNLSDLRNIFGRKELQETYRDLHWHGSFDDYVKLIATNPAVTQNAFQRIHSMIMSFGSEKYTLAGREYTRHKFFDDPLGNGEDAVFGLDASLDKLVQFFESAAKNFGPQKRLFLMLGPVGSSKSTIARLLKKGLERYAATAEGAVYTFGVSETPVRDRSKSDTENAQMLQDALGQDIEYSPMNVDPLSVVPQSLRTDFLEVFNQDKGRDAQKVQINGGLDPASRYRIQELLEKYKGDVDKVLDHVVVKRVIISEEDRAGITTFQPKDPKGQDTAELTGDINFRKLAEYGVDSDPRAFSFDGELCRANRGIAEFIEVLKLEREFLYELLTATQERMIKPKKFSQTEIDLVLLGHTNEAEYEKLQQDRFQEALRDRSLKIDIPYVLTLRDEQRIYEKDFTEERAGRHIAPHTMEIAAMFAVCSRLADPKKSGLSVLQKMKLYNGESVAGYTEQSVREIQDAAPREGHTGISPRFIQDTLAACLVRDTDEAKRFLSPFMLLNMLRERLPENPHVNSEDEQERLKGILGEVEQEYQERIKKEVNLAIAGDVKALQSMGQKYVENISAYQRKQRVKNPVTQNMEEPDENFMRAVEEKIGIAETAKDDFRREILETIGAMAASDRKFDPLDNERLREALEKKLFEDTKDQIQIARFVSVVQDEEQQQRFDMLKDRLIKQFGYNDDSATEVLRYVASLFAR